MAAGKIVRKENFNAFASVSEVAGRGMLGIAIGMAAKTTRVTTSSRHLFFEIWSARASRKKDPVNTR
jgi:hypothetical protein